jgi:glucosamine kinase
MKYFLGMDIGGTKTACVLADEHRPLARAESGSAKILRVEEADAASNLKRALDTVSRESGVALSEITASCIGTSGAAIPRVVDWLRQHMGIWVGGSLSLLGDEIATLDAAFPGGAGIVVIAGTGSNVIGRGRGGQVIGAGGWGPALADEGSGNLLGQQAVRAIFAAINTGEEPPLLHRVLDHLGISTHGDLVATANAADFSFAQLMPVIVRAAREGDRIAQMTLELGGAQLAGLVLHVVRRLALLEPGIEHGLKVALTGSVLKYVREVTDSMQRVLLCTYPGLDLRPGTVDPLEGALWHARRLAVQKNLLSRLSAPESFR